ncbi:MAG: 5-amino-6-(D-ribitylamino)uracil--L-tyrosine 4-hydroxyphenyl transferase CofH [SAR324 cluster bacterium]|nr:5-amino-6-(D-ribitylamino)uracil--L-tyrosine 4-hydroxyphenyl transferase CofH [SAR324 cluster bacterium]
MSSAGGAVAPILEKALTGGEVSVEEGARLFDASGAELGPLLATADRLRGEVVGEAVTYVVNRNINFTNVCVQHCGFCAFSRGHVADEGYYLPVEEVLRRAREAAELGATEVCVQAGLAPGMEGWHYVELCRAIKEALPGMHIHGFSPEEVKYGSRLAGVSFAEYLAALQEAGLGTLPGTAAEVLLQPVRDLISPGRITVEEWVQVIKAAHGLGIRSSSTMMYGHVETSRDKAEHLALLRRIQQETGGFTEFVPLGFIWEEAPMARKRTPEGLRHGPSGIETLKMYAVSRIMLHGWIPNIQVSWVKEGPKLAQVRLLAGANDLGGTLINESISTAAGAQHGQLQTPASLRALAREMGRTPVERGTTYEHLRSFADPAEDPLDPLDQVEDTTQFGSYHDLIKQSEHRFKAHYKKGAHSG